MTWVVLGGACGTGGVTSLATAADAPPVPALTSAAAEEVALADPQPDHVVDDLPALIGA